MMPPFVTAFLNACGARSPHEARQDHQAPPHRRSALPASLRSIRPTPAGSTSTRSEAKAMLADDIKRLAELQERLYAARPLGGAGGAAGDGRRRQGRRHQARDVAASIRRAAGASVQGAERGGTRPRFSVARRHAAAGARPHRHLQPLALRRGAGGARPPRIAASARSCRPAAGRPRTSGRSASATSAAFERHLARNGIVVLKFFLHVSKEEQRKRLLDGWTTRPSAGSSPWATSPSASSGTNTWRPTRT